MPKASKTADAFAGAVEQALERIADPAWLGERSPLVAPYFLGAALDAGDALTAVGRGQALRRLLQSAAATLNPETREILDASFFKRKPTLNNAGIALSLNKSEATYYRNRVAAIDALARQVNTQAAPPLRPESPSRVEMIGRAATTAQALAAGHDLIIIATPMADLRGLLVALRGCAAPVAWLCKGFESPESQPWGLLAHEIQAEVAPDLQAVLVTALGAGGWFGESHRSETLKAATDPDEQRRIDAIEALLTEETHMGMMVGVAVGWALRQELVEGNNEPEGET